MSYFWSPNKCLREGEEEEGEEEEERRNQAKVWIHDFCMDSSTELCDFCTQTTWVWIARVFFGD